MEDAVGDEGCQIFWHRNGELHAFQLELSHPPETVSGSHTTPEAAASPPAGALDPVSVPTPSTEEINGVFSCLDSPGCSPNGAQKL